jgi:hypothetical protein
VGSVRPSISTKRGGGRRYKFAAMKVPRQCPLVLLVKVRWRGGKTFSCKEGRDEKAEEGEKLSGVPLHSKARLDNI